MYSKNSMYFIDDMDKFSAYVLKVSMHDGMEHFVERGLDELVILATRRLTQYRIQEAITPKMDERICDCLSFLNSVLDMVDQYKAEKGEDEDEH